MRGDDVAAVAAVLVNAQAAVGDRAHVVVLGQALVALAAAEPGEDDAAVTGFHALGVWTEFDDPADDFVAHGERQDHAAVGQRHLLAAADVVVTLPDMQVGMADAAVGDFQQYPRCRLAPGWAARFPGAVARSRPRPMRACLSPWLACGQGWLAPGADFARSGAGKRFCQRSCQLI